MCLVVFEAFIVHCKRVLIFENVMWLLLKRKAILIWIRKPCIFNRGAFMLSDPFLIFEPFNSFALSQIEQIQRICPFTVYNVVTLNNLKGFLGSCLLSWHIRQIFWHRKHKYILGNVSSCYWFTQIKCFLATFFSQLSDKFTGVYNMPITCLKDIFLCLGFDFLL